MADETQYKYTPTLDEIVFENRNKEYGAYDLRHRYPKILTRAFLVGTFLFILMVLAPFIMMKIQEMNAKEKTEVDAKLLDILDEDKIIEVPEEEPPPPPPPKVEEPPKPEIIQNVVPEPKKAPKVETPPPPIQKQLETTTGLVNQEGVKTPVYTPPPPPPSTGKAVSVAVKPQISETNIYSSVDQSAEFPGGLDAFRNKIQNNFDQSSMDGEEGTQKVDVTFVVERDGSITDIKAIGTNKYFNEEAIRTVKSIKMNWTPGKIDGKPVRSRFKMPIAMRFDY